MLGAPDCVRRDAWTRRLALVQLGKPARQPCSKLGRSVRSVSHGERGEGAVVPSYRESQGLAPVT